MAENNNAYLNVKIAQLDARKTALQKELKELSARRKAYSDQLVADEKPAPKAD